MTHPRRMLSPAVAKDAAEAWQIASKLASDAAALRDNLAEVWGAVEDMHRVKELLRIQKLLASLTREVDRAVKNSQMTPRERNERFRNERAMKATA